jgi:GNAT superfamily N-acetyltransferase
MKFFLEGLHEFDDITNYDKVYSKNGGVYYLLISDDKIISQGAVQKLDCNTAEIRRLYVAKEYRNTRASYALIKRLTDYCRKLNIQFVRAEIFSKEKQSDVVKLCFNKGFYEIPAYKQSNSNLFIEFNLKSDIR